MEKEEETFRKLIFAFKLTQNRKLSYNSDFEALFDLSFKEVFPNLTEQTRIEFNQVLNECIKINLPYANCGLKGRFLASIALLKNFDPYWGKKILQKNDFLIKFFSFRGEFSAGLVAEILYACDNKGYGGGNNSSCRNHDNNTRSVPRGNRSDQELRGGQK